MDNDDGKSDLVLFREPLSPRVEAIPRSELQLENPASSVTDALKVSGFLVDRIVYQVVEKLSIPEGRCSRLFEKEHSAEVSLHSARSLKKGDELHVVRLEIPAPGQVAARQSFIPRQVNLGTVIVTEAQPGRAKVEVPPYLDLVDGDWLFPRDFTDTEPSIVFAGVESSVPSQGSSNTNKERSQRLETIRRDLSRDISRRLSEAGVRIVERSSSSFGSYQLGVQLEQGKDQDYVRVVAELSQGESLVAALGQDELSLGTETDPTNKYPHLAISGRLAKVELVGSKPSRRVGWFSEPEYFVSRADGFDGRPIPVSSIARRGEWRVPFRDLLSNGSRWLEHTEIMPGSLEWIENEAELERELPFDMSVAWKIADSVCTKSAVIVQPI
jgi:hypothetical protein